MQVFICLNYLTLPWLLTSRTVGCYTVLVKKIIVGMGLPGSGKTTLLKDFAERHRFSYISPDQIREEVTGSSHDQTQNTEVWKLAYERLREMLQHAVCVVFDATMYQQKQRQELLAFARESGAEHIEGVYFKAPFSIAHERNMNRIDRNVPEGAMLRMHEHLTLEPPELGDGFDKLLVLDTDRAFSETKRELEHFFMEPEFKMKIR